MQTKRTMTSADSRRLLLRAFAVCTPAVLVAVGFGAWGEWRNTQALQWPTANGVVTRSTVQEGRAAKGNYPIYHPLVTYRYTVGGVAYDGDCIDFGPSHYSDYEHAYQTATRYNVGQHVLIHVDPDDETASILEPGPRPEYRDHLWEDGFILSVLCSLMLVWAALIGKGQATSTDTQTGAQAEPIDSSTE